VDALPYAGIIRIRYKGLPVGKIDRLSAETPPAIYLYIFNELSVSEMIMIY
jgi:hypothetical protein